MQIRDKRKEKEKTKEKKKTKVPLYKKPLIEIISEEREDKDESINENEDIELKKAHEEFEESDFDDEGYDSEKETGDDYQFEDAELKSIKLSYTVYLDISNDKCTIRDIKNNFKKEFGIENEIRIVAERIINTNKELFLKIQQGALDFANIKKITQLSLQKYFLKSNESKEVIKNRISFIVGESNFNLKGNIIPFRLFFESAKKMGMIGDAEKFIKKNPEVLKLKDPKEIDAFYRKKTGKRPSKEKVEYILQKIKEFNRK